MNNSLVLEHLKSLVDQSIGENNQNIDIRILKDNFDLIVSMMIDRDSCLLLMDNDKNVISVYSYDRFSHLDSLVGSSINLPFIDKIELDQLTDIMEGTREKSNIRLDAVTTRVRRKNIISANRLDNNTKMESRKTDEKLFMYQCYSKMQCIENYYLCMITPDENDIFYSTLLKKISDNINKSMKLTMKYYNYNKFLMKCLDAVEDGISVCDKDGYLIYVNNACCSLIGESKEELLFKKAQEVTKNKPALLKIIEERKKLVDFEYFLNLRAKNKTIHLINSGYPVFADDGEEVIGAINIFRGIKRSRKLANTIAGYQGTFEFKDIIGQSSIIKDRINLAKVYSRSGANILIQGESGTGKELFAQSIHNYSDRKSEPFIPINCANFPNELIDSELFGYEEGAFTGAQKGGKPGKFELANGGTLFLDEMGEMPLHLQAKLLRVVETKTIQRIGGSRPIKVDVRIIAATNRQLEKSVKEGKFRKDLYYRLKVLFLEIPPLRERKEDILILAQYFIDKFDEKMQKSVKGIDSDGQKIMLSYNWPGNVRELENIISRALYISDGEYITREHLIRAGLDEINYQVNTNSKLSDINREILLETLKQTGGNKKKAAEILGISRPTVYRMLEKNK